MHCTPVRFPSGGAGFLCGPKRAAPPAPCSVCGRPGGLLCDGVLSPARLGPAGHPWTCDAPLCVRCTTRVLDGRAGRVDLCPPCVARREEARAPAPAPRGGPP